MLFGKRKLTEKQKRLLNLEKFLLRLVALVVPVYLIITLGVSLLPLQLEAARESAWALQAIGYQTELAGTGIAVDFGGISPFFFVITADCTGWKAMLFLAALTIAVPLRSWRQRLACIIPGIAILWGVNLLRVAAVVVAYTSFGYRTAMLVHDYLWQVGLGAAALVIWVAWMLLTSRRKPRKKY